MNRRALDTLIKARIGLLLDVGYFFFGRLALNLKLVEETSIPTLAVDGRSIFYNPDFVLSLSSPILKAAVAHEVMHCVLNHCGTDTRLGKRVHKIWLYATDYVVNQILVEAKFKLGPGWLHDTQYAGMSAEEVYEKLKNDNTARQPFDDLRLVSGTEAEKEAITLGWKVAVVQAATEAASHYGILPQQIRRLVGHIITPTVPWQETTRRFVTSLTNDDYSWRRANRKHVAQGVYMPSMYSESLGPLGVIIDTSGSIDSKTLSAFQNELQALMNEARPERVTLIYADAEVNAVETFERGEYIELAPHGGGGTDFCPALELLDQDPPVAAIYLTDLEGPCGDERDFPVLWCCTTDKIAPWGQTVKVVVS
jgi:predicted metal-dependent peptidase